MLSKQRQCNFLNVCTKCNSRCCIETTPPITHERRQIIEQYLTENKIKINEAFVQTDYVFPKVRTDKDCIFLNQKTRTCRIHPVKPETCVAGPITFDINTKTGKIEWYLKKENICPLAGVLGRNKDLLSKHLSSAKTEIMKLVQSLETSHLKAILKREEPETLKIEEDDLEKEALSKLL